MQILDGVGMVPLCPTSTSASCLQCMLCDRGWHARCRPQDVRLVSKRFVVCSRHGSQQQAGGPAATTDAAQQAATKQQEQQEQQQQQQQLQSADLCGGQVLQLAGRKRLQANEASAVSAARAGQTHSTVGQQQQQQQQQAEDDTEDGELPLEGAEPSAVCKQEQPHPSSASKRPRLAADLGAGGTAAAGPPEPLRSPSTRSSLTAAAVPPTCQPSPFLINQQQQRQQQQPTPALAASLGTNPTAAPDLDAVGSPTPLSPRLSLQPSWQASLAARASLDYGDL